MRLAKFLWVGQGQAPWELLRYRLREMYHCTPSQLEKETGQYLFEMLRDLKCRSMISRVERQRQKL